MLGVALHMILSSRRFTSIKSELSESNYSFHCSGLSPWDQNRSCDTRVRSDDKCYDSGIDFYYHGDVYHQPCGGSAYNEGNIQNLIDPCPSIINRLCSFNSGVISASQLAYFITLGLGCEGILLQILLLELYNNFLSRRMPNTCFVLSEDKLTRLQEISHHYHIPLNPNIISQDNLNVFNEILPTIDRKISELRYAKTCRFEIIMATAVSDYKKSDLSKLFRNSGIGELNIFRHVFEFADIGKEKVLPKEEKNSSTKHSAVLPLRT